jgi:hAT family C-terminal dimerisation region
MASSVSSERAFSSAGITISKHRNRLKPDVVEALQFLKCIYRCDLLFREELEPSTELEVDVDEYDDLHCNTVEGDAGKVGWDALISDLIDDEGFVDHDDNVCVQAIA